MMVKKTGTVRKKNDVRMLGFSRGCFLEMLIMPAVVGTPHPTA
jgi:hypothetical protein